MKDTLISFETAVLAKKKGFDELCEYSYEGSVLSKSGKPWRNSSDPTEYAVPTQSLLQQWIRETRGVDIFVLKGTQGYYWNMYKAEDDTYLGYSRSVEGQRVAQWFSYEEALEDALQFQLNNDLPTSLEEGDYQYWTNYVSKSHQKK